MKVTDLWTPKSKPTLSFELFPARSEKAAEKLPGIINTLAALEPDFVSVTFGAGGSTREGSRQLIETLTKDKGLAVVAYFACYGLSPKDIVGVLDSYQALGVKNVLAVRGDPPREEGFKPHPESLSHASELLAFIQTRYDFCLGAAGYPEGHIEATGKEDDLAFLKHKVDQGAQYIIANYFYDNQTFFDFLERCQGVGINVPIVPGIMPIYSIKMMEMLAGLCGAKITDSLHQGIAALPPGDEETLLAFGIDFAVQQCAELLKAGAPGLHIYTMDRSQSAKGIVNRLRDMQLL